METWNVFFVALFSKMCYIKFKLGYYNIPEVKVSLTRHENFTAEYILNGETIDLISEKSGEFLETLGMERANILGIRLSLEEALLRWLDHFGKKAEETRISFFIGRYFFRPYITIALRGEEYDPMGSEDLDPAAGDWVGTVMGNIGLSPRYSYQHGTNILQIRLNGARINPGVGLLVSIFGGLLLGYLGKAVLSESSMDLVTRSFFDPIASVFFKLLEATAGPVIFLTVLTAICGIGSTTLMNKSGKRMIWRFLLLSTFMTFLFTVVGCFAYDINISGSILTGTNFYNLLDFLTGFFPEDILSPFVNTDSPQLILLAIILGNALLVLGSQSDKLVKIANQANSVGLLIAEWISRLIPFFVALLLAFSVMDGSIVRFKGIWLPLILFHVFMLVTQMIAIINTGRKMGVRPRLLWEKIKVPFMIALKNASVDKAFGETRISCERKLGISRKLADYSLPLGLVIYMPASTVSLMVSTLYAVQCYHMTVSVFWLLMAMVLVVALQAASPPVSGVDTLAYAAIFARLGIPSGALIMAIVCDIIFCFLSSASNQALLQMELIIEADRLNELDKSKLTEKE